MNESWIVFDMFLEFKKSNLVGQKCAAASFNEGDLIKSMQLEIYTRASV